MAGGAVSCSQLHTLFAEHISGAASLCPARQPAAACVHVGAGPLEGPFSEGQKLVMGSQAFRYKGAAPFPSPPNSPLPQASCSQQQAGSAECLTLSHLLPWVSSAQQLWWLPSEAAESAPSFSFAKGPGVERGSAASPGTAFFQVSCPSVVRRTM